MEKDRIHTGGRKWGILTPQPERSGPFPRPAGRLDAAPRAVRPEGGIKPA